MAIHAPSNEVKLPMVQVFSFHTHLESIMYNGGSQGDIFLLSGGDLLTSQEQLSRKEE